ncbi:MAG: helix-turn-helix domain-containing protein [Prolixibacteraceae bacterium]|nr:helix-turn-helix domain-containing protein [Prolixibacteraceae bacterium]
MEYSVKTNHGKTSLYVKKKFCTNNESSKHTPNNYKPKLLLLEDDLTTRVFLKHALMNTFDLDILEQGIRVIEYIEKNTPDLILSEFMMIGINGLDFAKMLETNTNTAHIPLVFIDSKNIDYNLEEIYKLGVIDFVKAPFNVEILAGKLRNIAKIQHSLSSKIKRKSVAQTIDIMVSSFEKDFIDSAVAVINANIDNPKFNVKTLSDALSVTSHFTYRKIKIITGYTAKEFIRIIRLKTAAEIIIKQNRPISEIGYMVGFSSPSYFARCFKNYFENTPTEYNKQNNHNIPTDWQSYGKCL